MIRRSKETRDEAIGYFVEFIFGWAWITLLLSGIYEGGRMAASYLGWSKEPLVFGLLATAVAKAELWERWRRGESLKAIGRAFGKPSSPIYNPSTPYTVTQSPEVPVSPASPGSLFH
jgi:hypothetical protein